MARDIPYSTIEHQIEKLKCQKLIINDEEKAKKALSLYGYSNLIKSYREPYIIRYTDSIEYRSGITFDHIVSLYLFDKVLRNAVMASMLDLEEHIKGVAAEVVASTFGTNQNDYLDFRKYQNKRKSQKRFSLTFILTKFRETLVTDKEPIHHYMTEYNSVPPWILFKSVYFSTMTNYIDQFRKSEKVKMANSLYGNNLPNLSDEQLCMLMMDTLFICIDYRNISAHGGRIYNYKTSNRLRYDEIFDSDSNVKFEGFSKLLFLLSLLSYNSPHNGLRNVLNREITRHCRSFPEDVTYLGQVLNVNITEVGNTNNDVS